MFCKQCGKKIGETERFCPNCGAMTSAGLSPTPPPVPYASRVNTPQPSAYLVQAILVTLFCCMPFGIVAIVYAAQVGSKVAAGDERGAIHASNKAKTWCWVAFFCGLAGSVFGVLINIIGRANR